MKLQIKMKPLYILLVLLGACSFCGCKKFLDEVPDKKLVVPQTLSDLQGMLDDYNNILPDPGPGEISAGDYYLSSADWASLSAEGYRRMYIWEKDYLFQSISTSDWLTAYRIVYYANIVLENIDKIGRTPSNAAEWDNVKGQALFLRARSFLNITNIWTSGWEEATASSALGIPLRLSSDFNIPSQRSSLQQTYEQIISDLQQAQTLLPVVPQHVTRPSRPAALGLLARAYLFMRRYDECLDYSNQCLQLKNTLMDYNTLQAGATYPIAVFGPEVIYDSYILTPAPLNNSRAKIDSLLYRSYDQNDLRKTVFFRVNSDGSYRFKGSYQGSVVPFSGIATDEVYLMRAECNARLNNLEAALADLNTLLKTRWNKNAVYVPFSSPDRQAVLEKILLERRKELLMRGLRWPDLKRLNREGAGIVLKREVNDTEYVLQPNDLRYALPIPEDVISMTGMEQNPR